MRTFEVYQEIKNAIEQQNRQIDRAARIKAALLNETTIMITKQLLPRKDKNAVHRINAHRISFSKRSKGDLNYAKVLSRSTQRRHTQNEIN